MQVCETNASLGKKRRFFLSANSPYGFISRFDELYSAKDGWKAYILTGGPGTGKSVLLKKVAETFEAEGKVVEYIESCFDSSTIDAISLPDYKICIIDSSKSFLKLEYPGVTETIINLGDLWDEKKLTDNLDKMIIFSSRIASSSERASRFLSAAAGIIADTCRLALEYTDVNRLETYAQHVAKREFPRKERQGVETKRFLTAITPEGITDLFGTVSTLCDRVYIIEDEYYLGKLFLNKIRSAALSEGYDVITCLCPMFPDGKPEHLLIPSLKLAFVTSSPYHRFSGPAFRHIHMRRFLNLDAIKIKKPRLSFNRKAARELINESVVLLADAHSSYEMIKSFYTSAMDFEAVDKLTLSLINKINQLT